MLTAEPEPGNCFMTSGSEGGRLRPCSLSLMSFMAMENSSRSILPSMSKSARFLMRESWVTGSQKLPEKKKNSNSKSKSERGGGQILVAAITQKRKHIELTGCGRLDRKLAFDRKYKFKMIKTSPEKKNRDD